MKREDQELLLLGDRMSLRISTRGSTKMLSSGQGFTLSTASLTTSLRKLSNPKGGSSGRARTMKGISSPILSVKPTAHWH